MTLTAGRTASGPWDAGAGRGASVSGELIVIAGPTASGKTALAISVARSLGAEIVNADSQQIYRRFDIGTAKPSAEELASVPHHLISFVDPHDNYSAARYQQDADAVIAKLKQRGVPVVLVGGTGLYLRVLLHGVLPGSRADPGFRAKLEERARAEGREALHRELAQVDPSSAGRIKPTDLVRIIRALEIHAQTGRPASELRDDHAFKSARHPFRMFALTPPRDALYEAINARTKRLYASGLVEETHELLSDGYRDAAPMRSVGYAQALELIDGKLTLERAMELTAQATRNYAKRQLTWFKKEQGAVTLAPPYEEALLKSLREGRP